MSWPWLTGTVVLLFMFIMSVLGVPTTLVGNWQLAQSALRWWRERRWRKPEGNEGVAIGVTAHIYLDAIRSAHNAALPAAGSAPCFAPAVYSGPNANYGGAATTIPATLVTPVR